jgi:hypothetical protein
MNDISETPLNGIVDPLKAEQELNLIRYKRAFARRNFIKNVGLAGAGIAISQLCPHPCASRQTVKVWKYLSP